MLLMLTTATRDGRARLSPANALTQGILPSGIVGTAVELSIGVDETERADVEGAAIEDRIIGVDEMEGAEVERAAIGEHILGVVDMEETNLGEVTVDNLLSTAVPSAISPSTSGVGCLPTSGVVCPWHSGCRGPSSCLSGSTMEWMDRFRHWR